MKKIKIMAFMALAASMNMGQIHAEEALSASQKEAVKVVIGDYLKENPEVVIEAIRSWQEQQAVQEAKMKAEAIKELHKEAANTRSPIWGNPVGDVTVIEFFDYNCPYCKKVFPGVRNLIKEDGGIRVVMKEFPVLGENSVYAAKAALAAQKQGKYEAFHAAMMGDQSRFTPASVDAAAKKVGIDIQQMKKDMNSPEVLAELQEVRVWAERLGVSGTPAFVIGDQMVPGAIDEQRMKALVKRARNAKKAPNKS